MKENGLHWRPCSTLFIDVFVWMHRVTNTNESCSGCSMFGVWALALMTAVCSKRKLMERQQEKEIISRGPGMWIVFKSSLHSIIWPRCAQEEFKVWKGIVIWNVCQSRWLDCRKGRLQAVGLATECSDNIFPAAAPSRLFQNAACQQTCYKWATHPHYSTECHTTTRGAQGCHCGKLLNK